MSELNLEPSSFEPTLGEPKVAVDVYLKPGDLRRSLAAEVVAGLTAHPKELSPKWLYDERGSSLFEEITRLPEYYPTRRERTILLRHAGEIARLSGADTLVELGSGTSEKTRLLLDALADSGQLVRFVPFDVSEPTLREAAVAVAREYPGLEVHAVVGDFERHLSKLPRSGRRLFAFLGGTIGNLKPAQRAMFFAELASGLRRGESLLLGTDLIKDRERLFAAYNDAAGITARFNLNLLEILNRELGADFRLERFRHLARYDEGHQWVEMLLVSTQEQVVEIPALNLSVRFEEGEALRTEVSTKFRPGLVREELAAAGLTLQGWWTDESEDFAISLASPA
jgi:L-histidine Nalpha-methyltransferase